MSSQESSAFRYRSGGRMTDEELDRRIKERVKREQEAQRRVDALLRSQAQPTEASNVQARA